MRILTAVLAIVVLVPVLGASARSNRAGADRPWGYVAGGTRVEQQGNYCMREEDALEIAGIFRRFGARTGFSALTHAPGCSQRVHGVTPLTLLDAVLIRMDGGGSYTVNFITVRASNPPQPPDSASL